MADDPIKIMDEIERDERNLYICIGAFGIENDVGWQSLRTAIEAQQDRMAIKAELVEALEWAVDAMSRRCPKHEALHHAQDILAKHNARTGQGDSDEW